ncbi:cation diffusion facilitator family transporter [Deinococcus peraridilitoris]|uniref:Co/Zn/Cd efflux system component n=1 Tax=Deinococcus peraridilitoris (strain DSM 19664 / LMG 22246 / CIP 109416 / KR-200) TaxID=937777 RepID=L0A7D3_DEIPD|nr:cation diffusion facilitator family transporter [Deinococcus peraridilitoris]AFZ69721.1 Co/Zn/Cd efflux system component [Deinococcus peraridilitoris DSM 19664]
MSDHPHDHDAHPHNHGPGGHAHRADQKRLTVALIITATFMIAEIIGGLISNSLALLSDAGHMASDVAALALSLFALWFARKPATPQRTYGFYRVEILAAFVNAATLLILTAWILLEAYQRLSEPPEVQGGVMLAVAVAGLIANLVSAYVLHGGQQDNLNVRGAFLHVLGDLLGSVGAIIASLLVLFTGLAIADPIVSALIGLLIIRSAWILLNESLNVLLEGAPKGTDVRAVRSTLKSLPQVLDVHDLHVWAITAGQPLLTAHLEIEGRADATQVLIQAQRELSEQYGITHVTLQLEVNGQLCEVRDVLHA